MILAVFTEADADPLGPTAHSGGFIDLERHPLGIPRFRGGIVYEETRCHSGGSTTRSSAEGAVTLVRETGKPIAEVARDLGVGASTSGNWVHKDRMVRGDGPERTRVDAAYLRQREQGLAEVRMEREVLKRSVVL